MNGYQFPKDCKKCRNEQLVFKLSNVTEKGSLLIKENIIKVGKQYGIEDFIKINEYESGEIKFVQIEFDKE